MTGPGQELAAQQGLGGELPPTTRSPRRRVMAAGRSRAGISTGSTSRTPPSCTCGPGAPAARAGPRRAAGTAPAASQMRAAPDPRILTGWSGASPHVLRFPPRAFLRFPVCPPGSPRRPPSSGFPSSGVLRFVPFGRRPGSGSPFGVPPGSLPLGNPHDSAAAGRFRRRWSRAARAKVTSPAATLPFLDLAVIRPAPQAGSGRAQWMPLQNRLLRDEDIAAGRGTIHESAEDMFARLDTLGAADS